MNIDNKENLNNSSDKPILVIRQDNLTLSERVKKGESIYSVIADVLNEDYDTLSEYWERNLLKKQSTPLSNDLLTQYRMTPDLATDLDFKSGFGLVVGHWYPEIIKSVIAKEKDAQKTNSTIALNLQRPEFEDIIKELRGTFNKQANQFQEIRESLKVDPTGWLWLKKKMQEEAQKQPFLALEKVGISKAIIGAVNLHKQIQNILDSTPQKPSQ